MHKKIFVALAAALLITGGLTGGLVTGEQAEPYEAGLADVLPSDTEEFIGGPEEASPGNVETGTAGTAAQSPAVREQEAEPAGEAEEAPLAMESPLKEPAGRLALAPHEAVVKNYSELESALENDNGITTVYFGDDITMRGGIKINPKKASVIIDGFNPLEAGQAGPYSLTDLDSASFYDTIYIDEAGTKSLHIRNLKLTGKNYYGSFSIADLSALAGVAVTYEHVDYNGPQLGHHRRGTLRLIDCTARIHGGNGILSPMQEFSEAKHLVFEGVNSIDTSTSTNTIFWHPLGGTFHIADNASLTLISPNTSAAYGVFYADGSAYKIDVTVGGNAVFNATVSGAVAPELYVTLNSLTVQEGGAFYLRASKAAAANVLKVGGALTVENDASFIISGYGGALYSVLRQDTGDITVGKDAVFQITADSPYTSLLNMTGGSFICNDPVSVLLYNGSRDILATISAGRLYVNAQQADYWNKVSPGGLDNPPLYKWEKADKTNLWVDGVLAAGASADITSLSSNYLPEDFAGAALNAATFSMANARVLAFGRLALSVAEPTVKSTAISGVTAPGATVRASFTQQGTSYTMPEVTAGSDGVFHIHASVPLHESTVITVKSSWQYLTATAEVVVSGEGELAFFVPEALEFHTTKLSAHPQTVNRLNPDWKIVVSDSRGEGGAWSVYARLGGKLLPAYAGLPALEGSLIFVDEHGSSTVMGTDTDIPIVKHTTTGEEDIFPLVWGGDKGVLLFVRPGSAFADTPYTATILWTLVNGV